MATDNTRRAEAQHEVLHALLALIGSLAVAPMPQTQAVSRIRVMATLASDGDFAVLRGHVEDVLRNTEARDANMENVVRHCHELRRKIKEHYHILV
jgi:hypothetical protein